MKSALIALCLLGACVPLAAQNEPNQGGALDLESKDVAVALARFEIAPGFVIDCFASEKDFAIANPVAQAFDDRGRLWVLCMPTYPQVDPTKGPARDKLVILEDTDGDGRADRQTIFADDLHVPTGFELGDGGVYVAAQPDLLFLKDEDGDGRADRRERVLHGFGTEDSHHSISAFAWTPGGALCFQEGTFHHSQVETPHGPVRLVDAGVFQWEPRSQRLKVLVSYPFANPWGHVFDRFGQNFICDASGGANYFAAPFTGELDYPHKHRGRPSFTEASAHMRPTAGAEFVSSRAWPAEMQGDFLLTNVIGFRGIRQFRMEERGSGFHARKVRDLLASKDPNFRPVHVIMGPDGALYVADWWNPLIGHMQYSIRDPRRDQEHGRIWRITYNGKTIAPEHPHGRSTDEMVALLGAPEDRTRARARLSLRDRPTADVLAALERWLSASERSIEAAPLAHLEALWVQQHHYAVDAGLLERVFTSADGRVRAAAVRVAREARPWLEGARGWVERGIGDPHPRVRLEAVVALSEISDIAAVDRALQVLEQPLDEDLEYALSELLRHREPLWAAHLAAGGRLGEGLPAATAFLLRRTPTAGLFGLPASAEVFQELLKREDAQKADRERAVAAWALLDGQSAADKALALLQERASDLRIDGLGALAAADADPKRIEALTALARTAAARPLRQEALQGLLVGAGLHPAQLPADLPRQELAAAAASSLSALSPTERAAIEAPVREALRALFEAEWTSASQGQSEGPRGRFVRIELRGAERTLGLAEVMVFAGEGNIAQAKTATSATTEGEGVPGLAVDGRIETFATAADGGAPKLAIAESEIGSENPWWEVDLGAEHPLDRIVIYNREEPHLYQDLDGFSVRVLGPDRSERFVIEGLKAPKPAERKVELLLRATDTPLARRSVALQGLALENPAAAWPKLALAVREEALHSRALELMADALPSLDATPPGADELLAELRERLLGTPWHERLDARWTARADLIQKLAGRTGKEASSLETARITALERPLRLGAEVYSQHCARCHREDGNGAPGAFPPLRGSPFIDTDDERFAKIVLHGLSGALEVRGGRYDAVMEPLGMLLEDEDIAAVGTYVRNRFGHRGPAVSEERVAAVRAAHAERMNPWNAADLLAQHPYRKPPLVLFVTGDEEYRSEETMPMLAAILERDYGFRVHVAYAMDDDGTINPNRKDHIEGLGILPEADLLVLNTRFRALPEDQVQLILDHVQAGKPIVGFRTATHAFQYPDGHPRATELNAAWPARVFGQRWVTHHGHFGDAEKLLTALTIHPESKDHPILRGVEPTQVWSWLYHVDGKGVTLPEGTTRLLIGRALVSRAVPEGYPESNPVAWTLEHPRPDGGRQRVFFSTAAHPFDFRREAVRRLSLQGILWALGREAEIPSAGVNAAPVEPWRPNPAGFGDKYKKDLAPRYLFVEAGVQRGDAEGRFALSATSAELKGPKSAGLETLGDGPPSLGFWTDVQTEAHWTLRGATAKEYAVIATLAAPPESAGAEVEIGSERGTLRFKVPSTGAWNAFERREIGVIPGPGAARTGFWVRPKTKPGAGVMNLRSIELVPRNP